MGVAAVLLVDCVCSSSAKTDDVADATVPEAPGRALCTRQRQSFGARFTYEFRRGAFTSLSAVGIYPRHRLSYSHFSAHRQFAAEFASVRQQQSPTSNRILQVNICQNYFALIINHNSTWCSIIIAHRELQLDLGDGVSSGRMGHEWSIIRPNQETGQGVQSSNPIRLSTFRSEESVDDNWDANHRPSPRSQRRSRSSRAADIRVFI